METLVTRGRAFLADGKPAEAQEAFERAHERSGGSRETEIWVLRAWLDQGRINDAMNAIDELAGTGEDAYTDYLRGMAFYRRGKAYMTQGVADQTAIFSLIDASQFLQSATARNQNFADAYLPLAEAAWYSRELDVARGAAQHAVELEPDAPVASYMLGRVIFSQFSAAKADDSRWEEARTLWKETIATFTQAAAVAGEPESPREIKLAADIQVQLGNAYAWENKEAECIAAYAKAMGLDPTRLDYGQVYNTLTNEESGSGFTAALASGAKKFRERYVLAILRHIPGLGTFDKCNNIVTCLGDVNDIATLGLDCISADCAVGACEECFVPHRINLGLSLGVQLGEPGPRHGVGPRHDGSICWIKHFDELLKILALDQKERQGTAGK